MEAILERIARALERQVEQADEHMQCNQTMRAENLAIREREQAEETANLRAVNAELMQKISEIQEQQGRVVAIWEAWQARQQGDERTAVSG